MCECRKAEVVSVVSDSEEMVTFVTLYVEKHKINTFEINKIVNICGGGGMLENESKGRNKKILPYIWNKLSEKEYKFSVLYSSQNSFEG